MEGAAPAAATARRPLITPVVPFTLALFALTLTLQPFGAPYGARLDPVAGAKYALLFMLWGSLLLHLAATRQGPRALIYGAALGLALYAETRNFEEISLWAPVAWTTLVVLALAAEAALRARVLSGGRAPALRAPAYTLVQLPLFLIPLAVLAYNGATGATLSDESLYAMYQTSLDEAVHFVRQYVPWQAVVLIAAVPLLLYLVNRAQVRREGRAPRPVPLVLLALVGTLSLLQFGVVYQKSPLLALTSSTYGDYHEALRSYRAVRAERRDGLPAFAAAAPEVPGTWVVVLGESHSRHHSSVYGYERRTTPWLEHMHANEPNFILFTNGYANHPHTVSSLSLALTEASQYNDKAYADAASLIDIADAAGYTTTWISNQVGIGAWDNQVTAIAEYSQRQHRLNRFVGRTTRTNHFDEEVLPYLDATLAELDPQGHNLIVVHVMGSHWLYCSRFPTDGNSPHTAFAPRWPHDNDLDCYDNSILYTDHVMRALFERLRAVENFAGLMYFSDHGEVVHSDLGHYVANFRYEMTHIPAYVWVSDAQRARIAERYARLAARAHKPFTNDFLYDTLLGLMGIATPHYRPDHDLSAADFAFGLDELLTVHGQLRVADDPWLTLGKRDGFMDMPAGLQRAAHH